MYATFETIHEHLILFMLCHAITTDMKDNPQCMVVTLLLLAPVFREHAALKTRD